MATATTSSGGWWGSSSSASLPPMETAVGWLALLQESDVTLRAHALHRLLECVDTLWHEVAEALPDLESLAEDLEFPLPLRQVAAAIASRVFFHLQEPTQALRLALEAGEEHFQVTQTTPYVQRLVAAGLDAYIAQRVKLLEEEDATDGEPANQSKNQQQQQQPLDTEAGLPMDRLQGLVHRLLEASCASGNFDHALGIALEARETDQLQNVLVASNYNPKLLHYATRALTELVSSKSFRQQALHVVATCWEQQWGSQQQQTQNSKLAAVDLVFVYQLMGQPTPVANVLLALMQGNLQDYLLGLQLCFDLIDSGDQAFVTRVAQGLVAPTTASDPTTLKTRLDQAQRVLVGGFSSELALSFLHKQSHADRLMIENLKKVLEERASGSRSSVLHNAAVVTHAYLYAGTTNDSFLRDYLDWMKKASNWAKFSATASLGIVHAGHVTEAMHLLQPYLPSDPATGEDGGPSSAVSSTGGYAEGGSLYALGLIHGSHAGSSAEKRSVTTDFLRRHLRASHANEVISHGAALGVGLTAMGSGDLGIVSELKEVLYTDSAVAGEAAGIAIGMVLVGTGAGNLQNSLPTNEIREDYMEIVSELKNYARETQHEKIIRGISMGLALMNFGQEENADAVIEEMRSDRDPILRYGAQYALALAYCGTGSNKAIRILLHTAVSDVSDDVRMAAVLGLAFVLFKTPDRVPQLVKLLLESFNPHVRYASCMAVGIAMAGTGNSESIALLEPMLDDMTDFVRQGALLGTAMMYMQQSDTCNGRKIRSFRERLMNIVSEKHQSTMTKMGAIMSMGVLDAGGRNCSLVLGSRHGGFTKMNSAVGLALWLQYWHWFPLMHMFSLALTPTYTIGLNKDLKYPKSFEIQCNAKPSAFAYPKKLEEKKEEKRKRVETVTLSITAKEKARLARKRAKDDGPAAMEVEPDKKDTDDGTTAAGGGAVTGGADAMDLDEGGAGTEKKFSGGRRKRDPEPSLFRIPNPARITLAQAQVCEFDFSQRYRPIRPEEKPLGVIILTDTTPDQTEDDLGAVQPPSLEPEGESAPPEPFEWTPPDLLETNDTTSSTSEDKDVPMEEASPDPAAPPPPSSSSGDAA